jgi:hypothetical protein
MSNVIDWVVHYLTNTDPETEFAKEDKSVLSRINLARYYQLTKVAERMDISPTKCAQELLERAIKDAWHTMGYGDYTPEMLDEIRVMIVKEEKPK